VPETMIAGRGCGEEVCASAGVQLVENNTASAAKHRLTCRIVDKEFIARIFTHGRPPCKDSVSRRSPLPYRCLTKIRATHLACPSGQWRLLYRFSTISHAGRAPTHWLSVYEK